MKTCRFMCEFCFLGFCLPAVACQLNFTNVIYDQYGFGDGVTQQLSPENLTKLINTVLDGRYYNTDLLEAVDKDVSSEKICHTPYSPNHTSSLPISEFESYCPEILYSLTQDCVKSEEEIHHHHHHTDVGNKPKPSALSVWGYGLLFVTLINLCSLAGVVVLPLMNKSFYSTLLMFLIALAVGSLAASGVLVLIPEAFQIIERKGYLWKACVIMGGVYLFFITERVLKMITDHCTRRRNDNEEHQQTSVVSEADVVPSIPMVTYVDIDRNEPSQNGTPKYDSSNSTNKEDQVGAGGDKNCNGDGLNGQVKVNGSSAKSSQKKEKKPVATVAWMIIFGDAFHNFIDGLSIGAAFSDSILLGVSICIAVLCEELPHELGDFAILLNAGMSKKRALLLNFLSACTCYLGLICGITLSQVSDAKPWILGIAGGMFLYISLADMMPEMNHAAEEHKDQPIKVFLIQNFGLLTGVGVILLVVHFGAMIHLE